MRGAVLVAAALACACTNDPSPLDLATIAELARTPGNAEGYARTGTYDARVHSGTCDCPAVDVPTLSPDLPCILRFEGVLSVTLAVVQSDGALLLEVGLELTPFELVGGLDDDGTFAVGTVDRLSAVAGSGFTVARLDGEFDETGGFTGDLARRLDAKIADQELSCTEQLTIEATLR